MPRPGPRRGLKKPGRKPEPPPCQLQEGANPLSFPRARLPLQTPAQGIGGKKRQKPKRAKNAEAKNKDPGPTWVRIGPPPEGRQCRPSPQKCLILVYPGGSLAALGQGVLPSVGSTPPVCATKGGLRAVGRADGGRAERHTARPSTAAPRFIIAGGGPRTAAVHFKR
jgi:hypothetical protein